MRCLQFIINSLLIDLIQTLWSGVGKNLFSICMSYIILSISKFDVCNLATQLLNSCATSLK